MALTASLDEIVAGGNALLAIKPHWDRVRLGHIGQVLNGYAFKAELFTRDGGMPLIRIRDVGSAASETFYSGDYDERYVVTAGDLLVGMDGDFNCARWRGPRSLLNQRVCKITVDESLYLPRFLDYVLPGYLKAINDATSSITVKHLSSRTIQDIPLPLPPMDEQREIVAEIEKQFSRLDEAVANLQRVKANLKRYKAAVLKAAVEGRLVETEASLAHREGRSYETGEQLLQRTQVERRAKWTGRGKYKEALPPDSAGFYSLPTGWVWASGDQLTTVITDGEHITPRRTSEGVLLLSARNVLNGHLALDDVDYVPEDEYERISKRIAIQAGDVLLSCSGTVGRSCVVPAGLRFTLVRSVAVLRPVIMLSDFMAYNLQSPLGQSQIDDRKTQTAQANLFQGKIRQLVFALPPLAEQARIVAEVDRHLSILRGVMAEVDANLQRAQALRQSTLSRVFQTAKK